MGRRGTHGVASTAANLLLQADIVVLATGYTPLAKTLLPTEDLRVRIVPWHPEQLLPPPAVPADMCMPGGIMRHARLPPS